MDNPKHPDPKQELPAPKEEKLLRAPTFFEKYHGGKLFVLVGLFFVVILLAFSYLSQQTPATPEQAVPTTVTASPQMTIIPTQDISSSWQEYTNLEGNFSFKYPPGYSLNEQVPAEPMTVQLLSPVLPQINTNFRLSITYRPIIGTETLQTLIEQNKLCNTISAQQGTQSLINGETQARVYFDTPCGQYPTTAIYTKQGAMLYIITIETQAGYEEVKSYVDQIIATLSFNLAETVPQITPTTTQASEGKYYCTLDAKLCPDGSSVGRQGPTCEFAPCPGE